MDIPNPKEIDAFIPSKADMEHCPLCLEKWRIYEQQEKDGRVYFFCERPKCMVSIWVRDPMLGRWGRVETEKCAICSTSMRLFFRSDGYIKMLCPKCGCSIENVDNDKHAALMKKEEAEGVRRTFKGLPPLES